MKKSDVETQNATTKKPTIWLCWNASQNETEIPAEEKQNQALQPSKPQASAGIPESRGGHLCMYSTTDAFLR